MPLGRVRSRNRRATRTTAPQREPEPSDGRRRTCNVDRRVLLLPLVAAAFAAFAAAAAAKDFQPGDLRLCNSTRCVPVVDRAALAELSGMYYGSGRLRRAIPPALGVACYELRFTNGYVTGIVATSALDRFLSYGVNADRFARGRWYRVPPRAAAMLRRTAASLVPSRLNRVALRKSR
jgi:hypothetical protein